MANGQVPELVEQEERPEVQVVEKPWYKKPIGIVMIVVTLILVLMAMNRFTKSGRVDDLDVGLDDPGQSVPATAVVGADPAANATPQVIVVDGGGGDDGALALANAINNFTAQMNLYQENPNDPNAPTQSELQTQYDNLVGLMGEGSDGLLDSAVSSGANAVGGAVDSFKDFSFETGNLRGWAQSNGLSEHLVNLAEIFDTEGAITGFPMVDSENVAAFLFDRMYWVSGNPMVSDYPDYIKTATAELPSLHGQYAYSVGSITTYDQCLQNQPLASRGILMRVFGRDYSDICDDSWNGRYWTDIVQAHLNCTQTITFASLYTDHGSIRLDACARDMPASKGPWSNLGLLPYYPQ